MGPIRRAALLSAVVLAGAVGGAAAQSAPPRLSGTVIGNGERRAIFARGDGSFDSVGEGERLGDYQVVRIVPQSVWLRSLGEVVHVGLAEDAGSRVTVARVQPPAAEAGRQSEEDNDR